MDMELLSVSIEKSYWFLYTYLAYSHLSKLILKVINFNYLLSGWVCEQKREKKDNFPSLVIFIQTISFLFLLH